MRILLVVLALGLAACQSSVSDSSLPCDNDLQCPAGTFCQSGTCATLPSAHGVTIAAPDPVTAGKTLQLSVQAVGAVTWTVQESNGGTVDATGLYHAPGVPGTYHVVATSIADPTQSATVAITVVAAAVATIAAPQFVTIGKGGYTASVPAQSGATYAWTLTGGTINSGAATPSITFTAGTGSSVAISVTVTDSAGDGTSGTFSSTIVPAVTEPVLAGDELTNGAARVGVSAGAHVALPPSGLTYAWSIVGGTFSGTSTGSTATGQSVTYEGSQEGSLTLTCVASNQSGDTATNTLNVTLVGDAVATSTVTATAGNTSVADGSTPIALTVALVDANNSPVFADLITISASAPAGVAFAGANATVNSDGSLSAITGSNGTYSFTMTSTVAGNNTVIVSLPSEGTQLSAAPAIFVSGAAAAVHSTLSADRTSTVADGTHAITFTATVLDAFGNPVSGAPVQFKDGNANLGAASTTDARGHASASLTSTVAAVSHTVTAVVAPSSGSSFSLSLPGSGLVVFVAGDPDPGHTKVTLGDGVTAANGATGVADNSTPISYSLAAADAFGNATPGVSISVSATGSNNTIAPAGGQTNAGGIFTWALTTKTAEAKSLTITVAQPAAQSSFQLTDTATFAAGAPAQAQSSILQAAASSITAGSQQDGLVVIVRDQFSNLINGAAVQFAATGSNNSFTNGGAATSGTDGRATTQFSSTTAQTVSISATVGTGGSAFHLPVAPQVVQIVVGPAAPDSTQTTLTADASNVVADNSHVINYTATVRDQFGNLEPSFPVAVSASGSGNTLSATNGATSSSGVFTFSLKTTKAEQKTITITDNPASLLSTQTTSTFIGGAAASGTFAANPTTVGADGIAAATLTVTALDVNGNLSPNAGVALALTSGTGTFGSASGNTNSSGVYSTSLTSTTVEHATVSATLGGSISLSPVTINFVPGDANGTTTSITSSLDPITADGTSTTTITLQVEDALGHAIANLAGVGITVSGSGNTFSFSSPGSTDASGKITATLKSTVAESKTITATIPQTLAGTTLTKTFTAHFVAGVPVAARSTLTSTPQSPLTANGAATTTLVVALRDANNNLVPGASVTFTPIASGDTLTPAAAQSSSSAGTVSATLASTVAGTQQVSASVSGTGFTTFTVGPASVTFTPGDPSASKTTLTATPVSPATVTADGTSTYTITLFVADAYGNKITNLSNVQIAADGSNDSFTYTTSPGLISGNGSIFTGTTDSNGDVIAKLSTTTAEQKNISASIPKPLAGGSFSVSGLALTFVAGPPASANTYLSVSPATLVADGTTTSTLTITFLDANNNPTTPYRSLGATSQDIRSGDVILATTTYPSPNSIATTIDSTRANANDSVSWCYDATNTSPQSCATNVIDFTAGPASATKSSITPAQSPLQSITTDSPNNSITITATFLDQYLNPLSGTATVAVTGSANTAPASVILTSAGVASFALSSTHAEIKTITVTLGTFVLTTKVKFVAGAPSATNSTFTVVPSGTTPVYADGSQSYTATLTIEDAGGNPVPGAAVTLSNSGQHSYLSPASGALSGVGTLFSTLTSYIAQTESVTATVGSLLLTVNNIGFAATPWQPASGLSGARVTGIAFDPNSVTAPVTVYASTLAGVMKSTNDGQSWTLVNNGIEQQEALAIGATSIAGKTVLLALATPPSLVTIGSVSTSSTAYRSTDGGNTWTPVSLPGAASFIFSAGSGVFVTNNAASGDGGLTWSSTTLASGAALSLVSVASLGSTLIALNSNSAGPEVVTSTNGGVVWNAANGGAVNCGGNLASITVDGSSTSSVYYACNNGLNLYHSTNGGSSFTSSQTLPANDALLLAGDPQQPGRLILADTFGNSFESTNSGTSFTPMFEEYRILATSIAFDPLNHSNVWIGSNEGTLAQLFGFGAPDFTPGITVATPSGGQSYTIAFKNSGMNGAAISQVEWFNNGTTSTAFTYANGLYSSTNGSAFAAYGPALGAVSQYGSASAYTDLFLSVGAGGSIFYLTPEFVIPYRLTSATGAWTQLGLGPFVSGQAFTAVASPNNPNLVYAYGKSSSGALLYSSNNQGSTWPNQLATQGSPLPTSIQSVQVSPLDNSIWVYGLTAASDRFNLLVSQDGGVTFTTAYSQYAFPITQVLLDPQTAGSAYAVSPAGGIIHLANYGATNTTIPSPTSAGGLRGLQLALDADGSTYYALTCDTNYNSTVYRSINGGTSWSPATIGAGTSLGYFNGQNELEQPLFSASPTTPGLLLLGTDHNGILYTTTGGQ